MRSRSHRVAYAARALALLLLTTCSDNAGPTFSSSPAAPPPPLAADIPPGSPALLIGAGDIARCDRTNDEATGLLLDNYPGATVFTAGDNTNGNGTLTNFNNCYGPSWGRNKARTRPAVGNNDYKTANAAGFNQYFGAAGGEVGKYYYSYDLGAWHIMVLNDQITMTVGSPQELWLRAELAANTKKCTLAYWHRPRFSSTGTNNLAAVKPLWDALYAYNADVVVNANATVYERFAPQSPTAVADPLGIREFIVGTGGLNLQNPGNARPNSQVRNGTTYGVLKFVLDTASYSWEFVHVAGATFTDAGSTACHTRIAVNSVDVSPTTASISTGTTLQLTATPRDAAGNPLTGRTVTWTTSNATTAPVDANGLVTGNAAGGPITITATSEGKSGSSAVTVNDIPVATVDVNPATGTIQVGATIQLTASLKDANGNPLTGRVVTWTTSDTSLATVNASGLVTGKAAGGPVTVTATSEGKTATAAITVNLVPVASVDVTPATGTIAVNTTVQLTATPKDANGNPLTGRAVTWATADASIATVDANGLVTGTAVGGPVTITATSDGKSGTSTITVSETVIPVASVSVTPTAPSIPVGGTVQLTATPKDASGNPLSGRTITWQNGAPGIATVDGNGLVHGVAAGSATITATSEGKSGSAIVSVTQPPVAAVVVTPSSATIPANGTVQLTATPKDANGNALSGRTVTWESSAPAIAAVNGSGFVVGQAAGPATIRATSEGVVGTAAVIVQSASGPAVLAGAGDIADCSRVSQEGTARVLDGIVGTVATFGDGAYPDGTLADYMNCYDPSWGRHKARTRPSTGNHEYNHGEAAGAPGYYAYWGAAAGETGIGYYSYELGGWHIVVINSSLDMSTGSTQERWLRADLAAHPATCTLAYWHHPRFSSGGNGSTLETQPIWQALYDFGAEVVLNGHDHDYERFAPQTPTGALDNANGIREFVVGTGGNSLYSFDIPPIANSQIRSNVNYGVIKLTLWPTSYDWQFIPVAGGTFTDAGNASCHSGAPLPNQAPVANPGGPYNSEGTIVLDGSQSRDPDNNTPITYAWDLGDGTTATTATVTHTYPSQGSYVVTLTVRDAKGLSSTPASTSVNVSNVPPTVNAGPDQSVVGGTALNLLATFADPGTTDNPWSYTIAWGDGVTDGGSTNTQANSISASHMYPAPGRYTARVTVTDKDGGVGSDDILIKVLDPATVQVFSGASNIASCGTNEDEATAQILDGLPGTVFALGDNVNPSGSAANYTNCYTPTWGRHKARTRAVVGNHEYDVAGANAFYTYFKPTVGDSAKYYYSFDLGSYWHVIVLNNTASVANGAGSVEEQWLKADLAANTKPCTIAMFHYPLFFSSDDPTWHSASGVLPFWSDLYAANAEIVLNGQQYDYERFAPQDPGANLDPARGLRSFNPGTGGYATSMPTSIAPNTEAISDAFGVLKLTLGPDSYIWDFIPTPGSTFTDHGSGNCH
jgi:uncharacterized protein YjdB/PKD repeat protein